jgi:hypothetical protein
MILAAIALGGCSSDPNKGYTTDPPFRKGIKYVYVPNWTRGKDPYTRDLEIAISEAVRKRIDAYTPYSTRVERGHADTELTGSLDRINVGTLSMNPDINRPWEQEVTFVISFKWVSIATGDVLKEQHNFPVAGRYYPAAPLSENRFQGYQGVIDEAAKRVVEQMEVPFTRPAPAKAK